MQFSTLVALVREIAIEQVAEDQLALKLARLAFGRLEAQGVADSFFAMCRTLYGTMNKKEQAIEGCLREQVNREIRRRNIISHGDWLISRWAIAANVPSEATATLVRVQTSDVKEPLQYEDLTVAMIDDYGEAVEALETLICDFGCLCTRQGAYEPEAERGQLRLPDVFAVVDPTTIAYPTKRCLVYRAGYLPTYWPHEPFIPSSEDSSASRSS